MSIREVPALRLLALFALVTAHAACVGDPSLTGTWTLDTAAMKEAYLDEQSRDSSKEREGSGADDHDVQQMMSALDQVAMEIRLDEDGTCTASTRFGEFSDSSTGIWKLEGEILSITMQTMMDEEPEVETLRCRVHGKRLEEIQEGIRAEVGMPASIFVRR
jgi:hypothetical protein